MTRPRRVRKSAVLSRATPHNRKVKSLDWERRVDQLEMPPFFRIGLEAGALHRHLQKPAICACLSADTRMPGSRTLVEAIIAGPEVDRAVVEPVALWSDARPQRHGRIKDGRGAPTFRPDAEIGPA